VRNQFWTECIKVCVAIWENLRVAKGMDMYSTFIPLPKKGGLRLVAHACEVLLRIILERIRMKTESGITDEQSGFRKGRGTRDQITNLRFLMEKLHEHPQPLYMRYVDSRKVFEWVSHDKIWLVMMDMVSPLHMINLLKKLYSKQLAKVKVAGTLSEWFRVRQGLSSLHNYSTSSRDGDAGDTRKFQGRNTNWRKTNHEPSLC
jgi:Reverse transcriptase (RNA-dependent DNA polymerase)